MIFKIPEHTGQIKNVIAWNLNEMICSQSIESIFEDFETWRLVDYENQSE